MVKANTHIHFNGNCIEAFRFYEKCLSGKINFAMTWGESPAAKEVPADWAGKMIHASLEFDGELISGDDSPPKYYQKPQGFNIAVTYTDLAQAERVFNALSEKGQVGMPFGKTFWAKGFGMVTDQFGMSWMINVPEAK